MKVVWSHRVSVRVSPDTDQFVTLEPGDPFDMPDEEALARVAVGNVSPLNQEELMAAQQRLADKNTPSDGIVLEEKPEGMTLEQKPAKKKAAGPADSASEVAL